jgi:hypothetical protein
MQGDPILYPREYLMGKCFTPSRWSNSQLAQSQVIQLVELVDHWIVLSHNRYMVEVVGKVDLDWAKTSKVYYPVASV